MIIQQTIIISLLLGPEGAKLRFGLCSFYFSCRDWPSLVLGICKMILTLTNKDGEEDFSTVAALNS